MWHLPGLGIKPMSPALTGGFLTPEPPRKSPAFYFISFYFILFYFIYFFGCVGSLLLCTGFSLVALHRPFITVAPPCFGARALDARASVAVAHRRQSTGSVALAHGPSCSAACGILPDQGLNPCPLHWQAESQPLWLQGSPPTF